MPGGTLSTTYLLTDLPWVDPTTSPAPLFQFADAAGSIRETLTVEELAQRATDVAWMLVHERGLRPGDPVLLAHPPGLEFVVGFVACLGAGLLAVPVYPPDPLGDPRGAQGLARIAEDTGARVVLTTRSFLRARTLGRVRHLLAAGTGPDLTWLATDRVRPARGALGLPTPALGDPALLQYTSGSTSDPKGVVITHGNLAHQSEMNRRVLGFSRDSHLAAWVPQYHDFGLIGGITNALFGNGRLSLCSPVDFVRRPALWPELLHHTRATHTGSPTFGYDLAARKTTPEQRRGWDLSAIQVAMVAAEPVRAEVLDRFAEAFAPSGFRAEALCPAYGLAEHTVGVSLWGRRRLEVDRRTLTNDRRLVAPRRAQDRQVLVGCGPVPPDVHVRIVDPDTRRPCPLGQVGEIWVDSPSKAQGYLGRPEATASTFEARLATEPGRTWLRTGDLGAFDGDELFVTGRLKDLVILAGRNLAPEDLEQTVRDAHPDVRPGGVAAFSVDTPRGEGLAVAVASRRDDPTEAELDALILAVRRDLAAVHQAPVHTVIVLPKGVIPKTTSGKVQRQRCRRAWLDGALDGVALRVRTFEDPDRSADALDASVPVADRIHGLVAEVLGRSVDDVARDEPLAHYGMSSMLGVALGERLEQALGRDIPASLLFSNPTTQSLIDALTRTEHGAVGAAASSGTLGTAAVVGAGAGGVTAVRALLDQGVEHVTLFEAAPRVGGKARTRIDPDTGSAHDVGQIYFLGGYQRCLAIIERLGLELVEEHLAPRGIDDPAPDTHRAYMEMSAWVTKVLEVAGLSPDVPRSAAELAGRPGMDRPLADWLDAHDLPDLPLNVRTVWTAFGYGFPDDDIPAAYFLSSLTVYGSGIRIARLEGGNARLWEAELADLLRTGRVTAFLHTPVERVARREAGTTVWAAGHAPQHFDRVVIATPPHVTRRLLDPADPRQPGLSRFRAIDYADAVLHLDVPAPQDGPLTGPDFPSRDGGPLLIMRPGGIPAHQCLVGWYPRQTQGAAHATDPEPRLLEMARALGARDPRILETWRWRYFPHLGCEDFRAGTLQQLDQLQGHDGILLTGSYLSMEMVEHVVAHAQDLVARHVRTPDAGDRLRAEDPVVIVGVGCRFPGGVTDPEALWRLVADQVDAITPVPPNRWDPDTVYDPKPGSPGREVVREGGFVGDLEVFDAQFFRIAPREARGVPPEHRLVLETAWEALERAGIDPGSLHGSRTGVFVGMMQSDYLSHFHGRLEEGEAFAALQASAGSAPGRLSYFLGLRGPSMPIDTACSSALVALHQGTEAIRRGDCDRALVGGVNLLLSTRIHIGLARQQAMSPTHRCHAFSEEADGYVRSEGCGMFVLERLSDARRAGHPVMAIVRGSAVNHNGASTGFYAPSPEAQEQVIARALEVARVTPESVDYVECHGTGTPLGDPIEVGALQAVYGPGHGHDRPLWVSSVKSNLGHGEWAAGAAGLTKVLGALRHHQLPPNRPVPRLNPRIPWDDLPLEVIQQPMPWTAAEPRRAGLSGFGIFGTNAHVVLEEAPAEQAPRPLPEPRWVVAVSGATPDALRTNAALLSAHLGHTGARPGLSRTTTCRRAHLAHRAVAVADSLDEACQALDAAAQGRPDAALAEGRARLTPEVVFVFPGQGGQWEGMARALLDSAPAFRDGVQRVDAALRPHTGWSVLDALTGAHGAPDADRTEHVQAMLFATMIGLADQWRAWGVEPAAVIGHSQGEVAAACIAGALTLDEAAWVLATRARLLEEAAGRGAMAAVMRPADEVRPLLADHPDVCVAVVNSARHTVVSGRTPAVARFLETLDAAGIPHRAVRTEVAYHSPDVAELGPRLADALDDLPARSPDVRMYSSVHPDEPVVSSALYWEDNLTEPVRFGDAVERAVADGHRVFLEISPHPVLSAAVRETLERHDLDGRSLVVDSLRRGRGTLTDLIRSAARLHVHGALPSWAPIVPEGPVVDLPTYAFQRQHCWKEAPPQVGTAPTAIAGTPGRWALSGARTELPGGTTVHTLTVDPHEDTELADHRVRGAVVAAGAWQLSVLLAAASERWPSTPIAVTGLEWLVPLTLEDGPHTLTLRLDDTPEGVHATLASRQGTRWLNHTRARLAPASHDPAPPVPPPPARTEVGRAHLEALAAHDIQWGPAWNTLERAEAHGPDQAVGAMRVPDSAGAAPIAGASIDAGFGLAGWTDAPLPAEGAPRLPSSIEQVWWSGDPGAPTAAHYRTRPGATASATMGDVDFFDDRGRCLLRVSGLAMRAAARPTSTDGPRLWAPVDTPVPLSDTGAPLGWWGPTPPPDALRDRVVWLQDTTEATARGLAAVIFPATDDGLQGARARLQERMAAPPPWRAVWWRPRSLAVDQVELGGLDGLVRTAALEQPGLGVGVVVADEDALDALPAAALAPHPVTHLARGRASTPTLAPLNAPASPVRFDPARTVLLTGATGGLGQALARHLVEAHGVRSLLLASRRGDRAPGAAALTADLEAAGATVAWAAWDLSSDAAARALVALVPTDRPLGSVFHLAGVRRDMPLRQLDPASLEETLAAKVHGAVALHHATEALDLEHFVCFGSMSGTVGSEGQAAYAAANAALEALAHHRRARGLPGHTLAWGLWELGMGETLTHTQRDRLARQGVLPLATPAALALLDQALGQAVAVPVPAHLRVPEPAPTATPAHAPAPENPALERLRAVAPDERLDAMVGFLQQEVARLLGMPEADAIYDDEPLADLGVDSVMAVELRDRIQALTGLAPQITLIFDYPTVRALSEWALAQLQDQLGDPPDEATEISLDLTDVDALLDDILGGAP